MQLAWLHNETPVSLDRLELRCVSTAWNHSIFRGLRTLVIHDLTISSPVLQNSTLSLSQLLDILDSCGGLKKLDLRRAGPLFSHVLPRDRKIDLTQLEKISIKGITFQTYLSLFQHICLSKIVSCYIHCLDYDFDTAHTLIASCLQKLLPDSYDSLSVELFGESVKFSLSQKRDTMESRCNISIELTIRENYAVYWRDRYKSIIQSIPRIVRRECFANAEETKIYMNKNFEKYAVEIDKTLWIDLFKDVPNFKILTIRKAAPKPLELIIDALIDVAQSYTPQHPSFSIPLDINFIFVRGFGVEVNSNLFKYLHLRKTNGSPVKSLMILECRGIDEMDLQAVEDVVEKVVYHRYRRPF